MIRLACLLGLAACSVDSRSDSFRCDTTDDCDGDRVCDQGWCIAGGGSACPAVCDECAGGTCLIKCLNPNSCDTDIVCPADFACEVSCDRDGTCAGIDIDCSAAVECRITCAGDGSCTGAITCPDAGACEIDCSGDDSCSGSITGGSGSAFIDCGFDACAGSVDCTASCACDIECSGGCSAAASCPMGDTCDTADGGCESVGACDTC